MAIDMSDEETRRRQAKSDRLVREAMERELEKAAKERPDGRLQRLRSWFAESPW